MRHYYEDSTDVADSYNYSPNELANLLVNNKELYDKVIDQNYQRGNINDEIYDKLKK